MNREIEMDVMRVLSTTEGFERDRICAGIDELCRFANKLPWLNKEGLQRQLDLLATEMQMVMSRMRYNGFPIKCPFTLPEIDELRELLVPNTLRIRRDSDSPNGFVIDLSAPPSTDTDNDE